MIPELPRKGKAKMAKRENGSGTIIKRKYKHSTKYVAYGPAKYDTDENDNVIMSRDRIGTFLSMKDAREAITDYLKHPTTKYSYTVRQVYEEWKGSAAFTDLDKSTKTNWTTCWQKVCDCKTVSMPDMFMRDMNVGVIRDVLDYYAHEQLIHDKEGNEVTLPPLSKSYVTKLKALMTQLCSYAMEYHIIDTNYASLAKLPKMEAGKKRALTDLEFATLEKGWKTATGGDACYVLCYTGLRVSELCQLTKFSYDPKEKVLRGGLKTDAGKDRVIPVHQNIQPIIERWYNASTGPLYPRPDGKPYNKDTFNVGVWKPCMKSLGLPDDLTPHSARHTFGTRMSAAGARPEDIQRIMGHADYSMTANVYINQDDASLKDAISKMA